MDKFIIFIDNSNSEVLISTSQIKYARFIANADPTKTQLMLHFDENAIVEVENGKESQRIWDLLKSSLPRWALLQSRSTKQD